MFQLRDGKISAANAPVNDISCLLADRDGVLWVGTSGHGLARFQNGAWTICSTRNGGLATDSIGYLIDDDAGNLWIGSYEGLMRVEKKSLADFAAGAVKTFPAARFSRANVPPARSPPRSAPRDGKFFFPTIAAWSR